MYRSNHGDHVINADIGVVDIDSLSEGEQLDYFHASPVCKRYSSMNNNGGETELDVKTAQATAEIIRKKSPTMVTIENVAGYKNSSAMKLIVDALEEGGYFYDMEVYDSADYGAATSRKRLIVRANKTGMLPTPQMAEAKSWYSVVEDLIETLPDSDVPAWMEERLKQDNIDWRNVEQPLFVFDGGSPDGKARYSWGDSPLKTITASGSADRIILPNGVVKKATPRVLARITGLPDTYELPEQSTLAHTIVGNGVPVELTKAVIAPMLENAEVQKDEVNFSMSAAEWDKAVEVDSEFADSLRKEVFGNATKSPSQYETGIDAKGNPYTIRISNHPLKTSNLIENEEDEGRVLSIVVDSVSPMSELERRHDGFTDETEGHYQFIVRPYEWGEEWSQANMDWLKREVDSFKEGLEPDMGDHVSFSISLSNIESEKGGRFYSDDNGNIDLVQLSDDVFEAMGISPRPFRITESMAEHVYEKHKKELRLNSPEDAAQVIMDVMVNFDHVREDPKGEVGSFIFSIEEGRKKVARRNVVLELTSFGEDYLGIKTSGHFPMQSLKKNPSLWVKRTNRTSPAATTTASTTSLSQRGGEIEHRALDFREGSLGSKDINNSSNPNNSEENISSFSISNNEQTTALNAKQKTGSYNDVSVDDILFSISKNTKASVSKMLDKREDLTSEEKASVLDYISNVEEQNINNSALQLAMGKWFTNGSVRFPEDHDKCVQAVRVAQKKKVDALQYGSPMEIINAFADAVKEKPINPDDVPTLHKVKELDNGGKSSLS